MSLSGWIWSLSNQRDCERRERALCYLNVYDLTPINKYLYWCGLGIFHSGIEVHGMEYGFGAHEYPSSGVFEVEPRSCPGFTFRKSILLGSTDMSLFEFRLFMQHLASSYHGNTYHLIAKNCNHFTNEVCTRLTGKPIPGWVNRLARIGSLCNCLLPEEMQVTAVQRRPDPMACSDDDEPDDPIPSVQVDSTEDEKEDPDVHLLATSAVNVSFLQERPVRFAADLL